MEGSEAPNPSLKDVGEQSSGVKPTSSVDLVSETRPEFSIGIGNYTKALAACFDENGSFKVEYASEGRPWYGEHIASDLLHEPEATQIQGVFLGIRPLDFIDGTQLPERHPDELGTFFDENDLNLKIYFNGNSNVAVYNSEAVKGLIKNNADIFPDYDPAQPVGSYLDKTIRWKGLVPIGQNPMALFTNARARYDKGEIGTGSYVWQKTEDGDEIGWASDVARQQVLRVGLLLGVPRETMVKAIENRIKGMEIKLKLTRKHNDLFESSPQYRDRMNEMKQRDFEKQVHCSVEERIFELATQDKSLYGLSDEEFEYINSNTRVNNQRKTADFMDPKLQGRPDDEITLHSEQALEAVFRSGIKDAQNKYVLRYDQLKLKGLTGVVRRVLRVKSRADSWTEQQMQNVVPSKNAETVSR